MMDTIVNNADSLRTINLGIAGFGTVGGGLVTIISQNGETLAARSGCRFVIKTIVVRNPARSRSVELPSETRLSTALSDIISDPDIDIAVELMGGIEPAYTFIRQALEAGKHVVTANKALLAKHGIELLQIATKKGVRLMYEASVAGGIPIVQTLKESLAGNKVKSIEGILNGTSNFILSEMTSNGRDFDSALAEAQRLGYAEADPTFDIDGLDTAHKLCLLIRLAWGVDYPVDRMRVSGIRGLNKMDIDFAREFGFRIKLLGHACMSENGLEAGVYPVLVRHTYLLARVGGAFNAIRLDSDALGPLFLHGLGAGALPTGSAVISDITAAARGTMPYNSGFVSSTLQPATILPTEDAVSPYYVRFMVKDTPGVLYALTGAFAERGVSIAQVIQKEESDGVVPLIMMLHAAPVKDVERVLETVSTIEHIHAKPVAFRVLQ